MCGAAGLGVGKVLGKSGAVEAPSAPLTQFHEQPFR